MSKQKQGRKGPAQKKEIEFLSVRSPRSSKIGKPPTEPKTSLVIGIFAAVTVIFFFGHLFGGAYIWEDFTQQFLPFQVFAARSFSDGSIPFWNPYTFAGMPFFADLQNGFFYPGHQAMYILSGGDLGVGLAQFIIILHYFIAMVGMWRLAGEFGISGWGRMYSGIAYGLSGMMVVHMIHPNMIYHMAFFPLVVAWFHRGLAGRSLRHTLQAGLTLGLVMLSGHPQTALYIIFFLFALTVFLTVRDLRSDDPSRKRTLPLALGGAVASMLIAAGIFAVQYLPSRELAALSQRSEINYQQSLDGSLEPKQLFTLMVPKVFGVVTGDTPTQPLPEDLPFWLGGMGQTYLFWETAIFFGVVTLILSLLGLASRRMEGIGWFFAGMGLLGLLYALGDSFFVHPLLGKLPLFKDFRIPTRMAIYLTLGASLLAGVGLDRVIRTDERNESLLRYLFIAGGGVILVGLLTVSGMLPRMLGAPDVLVGPLGSTGVAALLVGIPTVLICYFGLKRRLPTIGTAIGLTLLCMIDLFSFGVNQNASPINPMTQYETNDQRFALFKAKPPEDIFRVQMRGLGNWGGAMLVLRNQGPFSGMMLIEGYNPLLLQRIMPPAPTHEASIDLLNVKYAISIDTVAGQMGYVERPPAYPHAWMVFDAQVRTAEEVERMMKSGEVDLKKVALLETEPAIKPNGSGSGTASITTYESNRIVVKTTSDAPGILVLSEIYYPSWKVTVDGKEGQLLNADWSLRGVPVPAGEHTVEMRFESDAFGTGMWLTLLSLAAAVAGIVLLRLRERKNRGTDRNGKPGAESEPAPSNPEEA